MNAALVILLVALVLQGGVVWAMRAKHASFPVVGVLLQSVQILTRNALPFAVLVVLAFLPRFLLFLAGEPQTTSAPYTVALMVLVYWALAVGLSICAATVMPAMFAFGTLQTLRGKPHRAGKTIAEGVRAGLNAIPLGILIGTLGAAMGGLAMLGSGLANMPLGGMSLASGVGLMGIPVMLATMTGALLYIAVPIAVLENRGPLDAIRRAVELSQGHYASLVLIQTIGMAVTVGGLIVAFIAFGKPHYYLDETVPMAWSVTWRLVLLAGLLPQPVCMTIVYHSLRQAEDGTDVDGLLEVFE